MDNEELLEKALLVDITDDKVDMDLLCADIKIIKDIDMEIAMEYILFIISFHTELLSIDTSQIQEKGIEFVRSIFQIAGPQNELKKFLDTHYLPLTYIYPCISILDGEDICELKKRFPKLMELN